jgi:hypothetical protein
LAYATCRLIELPGQALGHRVGKKRLTEAVVAS